jgi:hypothetical protein
VAAAATAAAAAATAVTTAATAAAAAASAPAVLPPAGVARRGLPGRQQCGSATVEAGEAEEEPTPAAGLPARCTAAGHATGWEAAPAANRRCMTLPAAAAHPGSATAGAVAPGQQHEQQMLIAGATGKRPARVACDGGSGGAIKRRKM